jgi:RNA polymerase sigma-70 factor (ECF subfamily)
MILETTIGELDPGYRIVFQLRDIEGFSTEETARTLELSLSAVKSRLQRARLQLRNSLDNYFRPMQSTESRGRRGEGIRGRAGSVATEM